MTWNKLREKIDAPNKKRKINYTIFVLYLNKVFKKQFSVNWVLPSFTYNLITPNALIIFNSSIEFIIIQPKPFFNPSNK